MRAGIIALALGLTACGQNPSQTDSAAPDAQASEYTLTCADFVALTPDALVQRFGAENITTQTLPGPEGESYEATLVFANDLARRLEVVWNETRTAPASVNVSSVGTQWRGEQGYTIGAPISEIESLNVMPFELWGFGWDYGGWVSDWNLGTFSQTPGCNTRLRFEPRNESTAASGDSEFASNDPAIRATDPAVATFGLMLTAPD
jgi:hypothetical protein